MTPTRRNSLIALAATGLCMSAVALAVAKPDSRSGPGRQASSITPGRQRFDPLVVNKKTTPCQQENATAASSDCGTCTYTLVDGAYHLQLPTTCGDAGCPGYCPSTLAYTLVKDVMAELLNPPLSEPTLLSPDDEALMEATRAQLARGPFWHRVSVGLAALSTVLAAGLILAIRAR